MIRAATAADLTAITVIRTSVRENHLSVEQLAERGVTEQSIAVDMQVGHLGAWVFEVAEEVIAFAMADKRTGNIFALFTHPDHEGKGAGSVLLDACENWLAEQGCAMSILDTDRKSRAASFYARRGWDEYGGDAHSIFMQKKLPTSVTPQ